MDSSRSSTCKFLRSPGISLTVIRLHRDMKDHMALACVLEDRFQWPGVPTAVTAEQKLFNTACDKWEHYERRHHHLARNNDTLHSPSQARNAGTQGKSTTHSSRHHPKDTPTSTSSTSRDPARRICRSVRVYVGWKA
jgi:hypothetical protein